jgi:hypothetical protein
LISFGKNQILLLRSLYTIWVHISIHDSCRNSLCFLVCLSRSPYTIWDAWFMQGFSFSVVFLHRSLNRGLNFMASIFIWTDL